MNKYEHIIKDEFIFQFGNEFDLIIPEKQMVDCSYKDGYGYYWSRCDLLALQNSNIIAIEIKSEYDTLKRLEQQLNNYYLNTNGIILIIDHKHMSEFKNYLFIKDLANKYQCILYIY